MPAEPVKFTLPEDRIPTHWVNLLPDLPGDPLPPLNPGTMQPAGPDDLTPIFPMLPRAGSGSTEALAAHPAPPRPAPRAGARYPGAHLLQV